MCFCCCLNRKSILIYFIVVTAIAFIYGIIALAEFGSSTEIYKYCIDKIEELESQSRRLEYPYTYTYTKSDYDYAKLILDTASKNQIDSLTKEDLNKHSYGLIKSLKGIENGLGVIIFIFTIIFLAAEIVYLIFAWGTKEFQILPTSTFNIWNGIKIGVYAFSIVFIFLSFLYGLLLFIAFFQWLALVEFIDSCSLGILVGYVYGYYGIWIFITLACGFGKERSLFVEVGSEAKPGPKAEYDVNGNPVVKAAVIVNPQVIVQPVGGVVPYQQVQVLNQQPQVYQQQPVTYQQQPMTQTQEKQGMMNSNTGRNFVPNQQINQ